MVSTTTLAVRRTYPFRLKKRKFLNHHSVLEVSEKTISVHHKTMTSATKTNKNPPDQTNTKQLVTPIDEARRFMIDCFKAVETPDDHAEIVADNLIEADYRGHYSHGMNRLDMYIRDIQKGTCDPKVSGIIQKESTATALVNGQNGLGSVIGKFSMLLAIQKAKKSGIAMVAVHGSNHFGIAGIYTLQAIGQGLIGLSFTNTSPLMTPTRAKDSALGTNPISLGAPALKGDSFMLDMATTAVAIGKVELARRKKQAIPLGWALNNEAQMETNPDAAYKAKKLMPLGGPELNSGYKGYGLSMLVEILCGILSGSHYGPCIRKWGDSDKIANLGHAFIAIDPKCFADVFEKRMSDMIDYLRKMEPFDLKLPVLVHGDPERVHMEKVKKDGGFLYVQNQHDTNKKLAEQLKVKPMVSKTTC